MTMDEQKRYWVWLSSINGIGPVTFYDLIAYFGDAKSVWTAAKSRNGLFEVIGKKQEKIKPHLSEKYIDTLLEKCDRLNIDIVTRLDDDYPSLLAEIANPPPSIYYKGNIKIISKKAIAIVGTRNCSINGFDHVKKIAYDLALNDVCVVSGMARGIDSASHIGALKAKGRTVAVLGCGVDMIYPPESEKLYDEIIQSGVIISEYIPGVEPLSFNFPPRNRIISGLSRGVLVVESAFKGGANITVKYATQQGRDIMALPGAPYDAKSNLPNSIIKNGGLLVEDANDILNEYNWPIAMKKGENSKKIQFQLDFFEQQIYNLLLQGDLTVDELFSKLTMEQLNFMTALTMLEMKGIIQKKPGNMYGIKYIL
jgi:DNA processing protein